VGDDHPGQWVPFWEHACQAKSQRACDWLAHLEAFYCKHGAGWACNERGLETAEQDEDHLVAMRQLAEEVAPAVEWMRRGCNWKFEPSCTNAERLAAGDPHLARGPPTLIDYYVMLVGSKHGPLPYSSPQEIYASACAKGWSNACRAQ
jgi:hypothetical protein